MVTIQSDAAHIELVWHGALRSDVARRARAARGVHVHRLKDDVQCNVMRAASYVHRQTTGGAGAGIVQARVSTLTVMWLPLRAMLSTRARISPSSPNAQEKKPPTCTLASNA